MSIDAIDVAFAGVIVTGISIVAAYLGGRSDRRSARELAHDERLAIRRADVYVDLLDYIYRNVAHVDHHNVSHGKMEFSEDEARRLQARLTTAGSPEVAAAAQDVVNRSLAIYGMALMRPKRDAADEVSNQRNLDMVRADLMDHVKALERLIAAELTVSPN